MVLFLESIIYSDWFPSTGIDGANMNRVEKLAHVRRQAAAENIIVVKKNFFFGAKGLAKKEQMISGDHLGEVVLRVSCCRLPPARARARHDAGLGDFGSILTRPLVPEPKMEVDLVWPTLLPPPAAIVVSGSSAAPGSTSSKGVALES